MRRITVDFHPVSAAVVPVLAGAAGSGVDWLLHHPDAVTGALARFGTWGAVAAVLVAGALPSLAKLCRNAAGLSDGEQVQAQMTAPLPATPPDAAPASAPDAEPCDDPETSEAPDHV